MLVRVARVFIPATMIVTLATVIQLLLSSPVLWLKAILPLAPAIFVIQQVVEGDREAKYLREEIQLLHSASANDLSIVCSPDYWKPTLSTIGEEEEEVSEIERYSPIWDEVTTGRIEHRVEGDQLFKLNVLKYSGTVEFTKKWIVQQQPSLLETIKEVEEIEETIDEIEQDNTATVSVTDNKQKRKRSLPNILLSCFGITIPKE